METSTNKNQIINELEQVHKLLVTNEKLSNIEIDLILSKLRNLYDLVLNLDFSEPIQKIVIPVEQPKIEAIVEQIIEVKPDPIIEKIEEPIAEIIEEKIEEVIEEPIFEMVEEPKIEAEIQVKQEEKVQTKASDQKFLHEMFQNLKNKSDLSEKFKSQPIKSIKSSIGLNDKFLMINELFNKNSDKFNAFIEKLDNLQNLDEATNFIRENLTWDETQESATHLLELVYRRFAV